MHTAASFAAVRSDSSTFVAVILTVLPIVIIAGAGWSLFVWFENRRLGGRGQSALFRRALKSAEIPEGANAAVWLSCLQRDERLDAKRGWTTWILFVVVLAIVVGINIASTLDADSGVGKALALLLTLAVAAALVAGVMVGDRLGRRRRGALRAALERVED